MLTFEVPGRLHIEVGPWNSVSWLLLQQGLDDLSTCGLLGYWGARLGGLLLWQWGMMLAGTIFVESLLNGGSGQVACTCSPSVSCTA